MQLPYGSWIAQIVQVVHGTKESSRFAMYKSYADEANIQRGDPYCTVAGYSADVTEWAKFAAHWRFVRNMVKNEDLKLFDFNGLMLLLQGTNRYTKSSFLTLDQMFPSLPLQRRMEVLGAMRKVTFRRFSGQWQPSALAGCGKMDKCDLEPLPVSGFC
jgi:hypothetical protein